jgi:DNA (cytosine-5)-methyltransferase 1
LENVCGAITSHGGKDFATICSGFERLGYFVGALVVNASLFVPQSRPRLFFVGVRRDMELPESIFDSVPSAEWHPKALRAAYGGLSSATKLSWVWWNLPSPQHRRESLIDLLEDSPADVPWFSEPETERLLSLMNPLNRAKVRSAMKLGHRIAGCVYKRTRPTESGIRIQRAEVRFDEIAGCLRTPTGGSSRQVILIVEGQSVRARLISARETARLMGLDDSYKLPVSYNEAYHLTGDGVVVPVVRYLAEHILEPLIEHRFEDETVAA